MKDTIVYLTKYRKDNSFGGMVRVNDIASKLPFAKKVYLEVSFLCIKPRIYKLNDNEEHIIINPFMFRKAREVLAKAKVVYCHSVGNYIKNYFFLSKYKKELLDVSKVLDWHASQPEEFQYMKKPFLRLLFSYFEKKAANFFDYYISVTRSMQNHFYDKYKVNPKCSFVIPISSSELGQTVVSESDKASPPVIVYCGGVQAWQNVEEMVCFIRNNIDKNVLFLILTHQVEQFWDALKNGGVDLNDIEGKVTVKSAKPSELPAYYTSASYGLLLRDEHVLNKVANPTKLSEYLAYGITPIIKTPHIGDYDSLGYEYISYLDDVDFEAKMSIQNINVFHKSQASELNKLIGCIKDD